MYVFNKKGNPFLFVLCWSDRLIVLTENNNIYIYIYIYEANKINPTAPNTQRT